VAPFPCRARARARARAGAGAGARALSGWMNPGIWSRRERSLMRMAFAWRTATRVIFSMLSVSGPAIRAPFAHEPSAPASDPYPQWPPRARAAYRDTQRPILQSAELLPFEPNPRTLGEGERTAETARPCSPCDSQSKSGPRPAPACGAAYAVERAGFMMSISRWAHINPLRPHDSSAHSARPAVLVRVTRLRDVSLLTLLATRA